MHLGKSLKKGCLGLGIVMAANEPQKCCLPKFVISGTCGLLIRVNQKVEERLPGVALPRGQWYQWYPIPLKKK